VRLSWLENGYARPFFLRAILTSKVDQTDPALGMQLGFISWSVRAKLQVSVCSGYDFIPL